MLIFFSLSLGFSDGDHHGGSCCVTWLQAAVVSNLALEPCFVPPTPAPFPSVMCLLVWFQRGSFEARLNPSGRAKSPEPALPLPTFES